MYRCSQFLITSILLISSTGFAYQAPPTTPPQTNVVQIIPNSRSAKDDEITAAIEKRIREDYFLAPYLEQIIITTNNGVVTMTGTIGSYNARLQLEKKARDVTGVKQVIMNVDVNTTPAYKPPL